MSQGLQQDARPCPNWRCLVLALAALSRRGPRLGGQPPQGGQPPSSSSAAAPTWTMNRMLRTCRVQKVVQKVM